MDIHWAEVQLFRFRAMKLSLTGGGTIYWDPANEGSYLSIVSGDAGAYTLDFTNPGAVSRSGMIIRVDFFQDQSPGGGATLTWPAGFKFQTAGDALPNSSFQFLTAWEGQVWPHNNANMLMTKLGEWDLS